MYTVVLAIVLFNRLPGVYDATIGAVLNAAYHLLPWG